MLKYCMAYVVITWFVSYVNITRDVSATQSEYWPRVLL